MKYFWERRVGVHSLEKLGAKMVANSFYYQRVRAERNSKNLGALNTLHCSANNTQVYLLGLYGILTQARDFYASNFTS